MKHKCFYKNEQVILSIVLFIFSIIICTSCSKKNDFSKTDISNETTTPSTANSIAIRDTSTVSTSAEGSKDSSYNADDLIENSSFTNIVSIAFGTPTVISNPLSSKGVTISQNGDIITITSTAKAVAYEISGTTTNGSIKIYSDNKFQLTLKGTSITNTNGPAINIQSKKRVFVVVADTIP